MTARDSRTWGASSLMTGLVTEQVPDPTNLVGQVDQVSDALGNPWEVARASYIHPDIAGWYESGTLETHRKNRRSRRWMDRSERTLLWCLENRARMPSEKAWSARYDLAFTPWDLGEPHPELTRRVADDPALGMSAPGTVYVPGCGSGHDATALAVAGWNVMAVDFAPGVESQLRARLEPFGSSVHIGDALDFRSMNRFDLIFDHTFFCAIDPETRPQFGAMVDRILAEHGVLASVVYPIGKADEDGGPPWGIEPDTISRALGSGFELKSQGPPGSLPGRRWPHIWAEWHRT